MRAWAFVSQKGGSGKSTLSTQISAYAEQCGESVCIVDMDPQQSAVAWSTLRGKREPLVIKADAKMLPQIVEKAPSFGMSLILIDTAPHSDAGAIAAIRAATLIVCPTQPAIFDLAALSDTVDILKACESVDRSVTVINCLPHQGANDAYEEASTAIKRLGIKICRSAISHRRPFVTSSGRGRGVTEIAKSDKAASEIRALWEELSGLDPKTEKRAETEMTT